LEGSHEQRSGAKRRVVISSVNGKTGAVTLPGLTSEGNLPTSVVSGNHHWDASDNIAIGSTLSALTVGSGNASLGVAANNAVTSGENNVAIGNGALAANTTHRDNIAIGTSTLEACTTGYANTALGQMPY